MTTQSTDDTPVTTAVVHAVSTDSPLRANGQLTDDNIPEANNNNITEMTGVKDVDQGELSGIKNGVKNGSGNSMTAQSMDDILTYDGKEVEYSVLRPENGGLSWYIMRIICPCRRRRAPTFITTETAEANGATVGADVEEIEMTEKKVTNINGELEKETGEVIQISDDKELKPGSEGEIGDENERKEPDAEDGEPGVERENPNTESTQETTKNDIDTLESVTNDAQLVQGSGETDELPEIIMQEGDSDVVIEEPEQSDALSEPASDGTCQKFEVGEHGSEPEEDGSEAEEHGNQPEDDENQPDEHGSEQQQRDELDYELEEAADLIDQATQQTADLAVTPAEAVSNHTQPTTQLNVPSEELEPEQEVIEMPPAMAIQDHLFGSQPPPPPTDDVDDLHSKLASTLCLKMPTVDGGESTMATTSVDIAAEMEMLVKQRIDSQASGAINAVEEESVNEDEIKEKCAHKRGFVIEELIDTEKDYVKDLRSIVEGYMGYMQENPLPEDMVGKDKIVFGNIHQIYDFHNETFLAELEKCVNDNGRRVGSLFNRYERRLYMYVKYCENKPKSEYIVAEYADTYFEDIRQKLGHRLQLPDLLIKPVQRIMKYQLLIKDILKYTERAGDDTTELRKAVNVMCVVPKAANDMMNVGRLQGFDGKITAQGKLLLQDTVMVAELTPGVKGDLKFKERRVFLFEQILIFSEMLERKKGYLSNPGYIFKHSIKVNKMSMRTDSDPVKFTLVDGTPGSNLKLMIQAPDEETKDTWITQIQSILDMQGDFLRALQSPIAYMNKMQKSSGSQKELVKELSAPDISSVSKGGMLRKTQSQPVQPRALSNASQCKESDTRQEKCRSVHSPLTSATNSSIEEETPKSSCANSPESSATHSVASKTEQPRTASIVLPESNSSKPKKNVGILEGFRNTLGRKTAKNEQLSLRPGNDQSGDSDSNDVKTGSIDGSPRRVGTLDVDTDANPSLGKVISDFASVREDEISVSKGEIIHVLATNQHNMFLVHRPSNENSPAAEGWIPGHVVGHKYTDGSLRKSAFQMMKKWRMDKKDPDATRSLERRNRSFARSTKFLTSDHSYEIGPLVIQPLSDVTVRAGEIAVLTCKICGRPRPNVAWKSPDNLFITPGPRTVFSYSDDGIATMQLFESNRNDSGQYTCVATSDLGSVSSAANLNVLDRPDCPGRTEIRSQAGTSVHLEWSPPANASTMHIQGYTVELLDSVSQMWQAAVAYVPTCTQTVEDLAPGLTYRFRVSAHNPVGISDPGQHSDIVTIPHEQELNNREETNCTDWKTTYSRDYKEICEIARGRFSVVRKCVQKGTSREVAVKVVSRKVMSQQEVELEYSTLSSLQHHYLLKILALYKTNSAFLIVTELFPSGRLFDHICAKAHTDEIQIAVFIRQLLEALLYLHNCRIAHLDIKPENLLVDIGGICPSLRLIDFGDARHIYNNYYVHCVQSSPEFLAPELVHATPVSLLTDIWGVGVLMYVLLSGISPFLDESQDETCSNIVKIDYCFPDEYFNIVSDEAKSLIRNILVESYSLRPSAQTCLESSWLKKCLSPPGLSVIPISTARLNDFIQRRKHQSDM